MNCHLPIRIAALIWLQGERRATTQQVRQAIAPDVSERQVLRALVSLERCGVVERVSVGRGHGAGSIWEAVAIDDALAAAMSRIVTNTR